MKTVVANLSISNEALLPVLFGDLDRNLRLIEHTYGVILSARGARVQIEGAERSVASVEHLFRELDALLAQGVITGKNEVNDAIKAFASHPAADLKDIFQKTIPVSSRKRAVSPKNETQRKYVEAIKQFDVVFGSARRGPARPTSPWPWPYPPCCTARSAGSSSSAPPWKQGKSSAFCPAISRKR
jgi:phosphate starvation-inducible PhoH-like protein